MVVSIEIIQGIKEITFPIVKVTKSVNGKTGTATFLFINPKCFKFFSMQTKIETLSLFYEAKKLESKDIKIFFKNGKPFLLKGIFIFKNANEWFNFLNFMNFYSKEKGFLFELQNLF
jgi:photosystem II protein